MADRAEVPSRQAGVVIPVCEVLPATDPLPEVSYATAVDALLMPPSHPWDRQPGRRPDRPVAACSEYHGRLAARVEYHPVVAATTIAFSDHRMLTLSPDMIWLLIAQGFANHVNANAEKLRPRLVRHPGKLELRVRRDDFEKNSADESLARGLRCIHAADRSAHRRGVSCAAAADVLDHRPR